jgi:hypothetical protein
LPSQASGHSDAKRDRDKGDPDSLAERWPRAPKLVSSLVGLVISKLFEELFFDRQRASGELGLCRVRYGIHLQISPQFYRSDRDVPKTRQSSASSSDHFMIFSVR